MTMASTHDLAPARPTDDARLVIEAMYEVAANPEAWERLIDVLDEDGLASDPDPELMRKLALSEDIARLAGRPGEGAQAPGGGRSDIGWLLLTPRGKLIGHNPAAAAVMAEGLGRLEIGQAVGFENVDNAEALTRALDRSRSQRRGQVILKLERDAEEGPRFAYMVPAQALPGLIGPEPVDVASDEENYALVFPAAAETSRLWASISESFGLTPAEVRLARKLREGRSLQEAAGELSVSVNTVRNQLRAVFDKMGLKRQSDLIRALTELSALAGLMEDRDPARAQEDVIARAPPVRRILLRDGRALAYRDYGDPLGKPMLSFHEGMGSSLLPPGTDEGARRLGLRMVCAERPGFGRSDARPDYSFDGVARDMVELCDQLGFERLQVGGVLSGAPAALRTAVLLGERAERVHLYSGRPPHTATDRPPNPLTSVRRRIEANPWLVETLFAVLRLRLSPSMMARLMARSSAQSPGDQAYLRAHPELASFVAAYVGEALALGGRGPSDELRAFRRRGEMSLDGLKARLIVWHGEEDHLAPLAPLLEFLDGRADEVRLIPDVGHLMVLKHWDQILRAAAAGP